jgi:hypothetical protein
MLIWTFFLVLVCGTRAQSSSATSSYTLCRGRSSQIRHPWDLPGAGPENFPNHGWPICYGTNTPESQLNVLVFLHNIEVLTLGMKSNACAYKHYQYHRCLLLSLKPYLGAVRQT